MGVKQIMSEYKEAVIEDIISTMKKNSWRADTKMIMRAYEYAKTKHGDQLRRSGTIYNSSCSGSIYTCNFEYG